MSPEIIARSLAFPAHGKSVVFGAAGNGGIGANCKRRSEKRESGGDEEEGFDHVGSL
jgi:hypothetical protein